MKRHLFWLVIISALALCALAIGCSATEKNEGREKEYALQQEKDQGAHAVDRDPDQTCDEADIIVANCEDACSCCYLGQEVNMETCVLYCDALLERMYDDNVVVMHADFHRYVECTLGCVSLCGEREKTDVCYDECKRYLGLGSDD
jgi:hypothetical protein